MSIIPTDVVLHILSFLHKTTITWSEPVKHKLKKCAGCEYYHENVEKKRDYYTKDVVDKRNITAALALKLVSSDCDNAFGPLYIHLKIGGDFGVREYTKLMKFNLKLAKPFLEKIENYTYCDLKPYAGASVLCSMNRRGFYSASYPDLMNVTSNFYSAAYSNVASNLYTSFNNSISIVSNRCERFDTIYDIYTKKSVIPMRDVTKARIIRSVKVDNNGVMLVVQSIQDEEPEIVQLVQIIQPVRNLKPKKRKQYSRKDIQRANKIIQRKQKYQKNYR